MCRWKAFLPGAFLLFWANCVSTQSVWKEPYFLPAVKENDNVTWTNSTEPTIATLTMWEGMEETVELLRITYEAQGDDTPSVRVTSGSNVIGVQVDKDEYDTPFFLQATEPADYEAGPQYIFLAVNAPTGSTTTGGTVTITVQNVNDNPPIITSPSSCAIEENYEGLSSCSFQVTDADGGACFAEMKVDNSEHFSFILESGQAANCKTGTFTLKVENALDFEQYRLHSLTITAKDCGRISATQTIPGGCLERSVSFVVDVIDLPDEPPRWEVIVPSVTVDELESWSVTLRAVDGDYGLNWSIVYDLNFPDDEFEYSEYFHIDTESGLLTGEEIDRDTLQREIYKFQVVATEVYDNVTEVSEDFTVMSVTNDIVIMVNDINNNIPTIIPDNIIYLNFSEESPFTDKNFTVYDPDLADNGTFELTLVNNTWSSNFLLIPGKGYQSAELTIQSLDPTKLDYEDPGWRFIDLEIVATEEADPSHFTIAKLRIELLDELDEAPVFDENEIYVTFTENQPLGYDVVSTPAHDPDEQDVITFTLRNSHMTIDDEGNITTITANAFDYERQDEIILQVVVEDSTGLKDFCQVNIILIDLNDEMPSIYMPFETYPPVDEHSPEGERASYNITATDPDTNSSLDFEIDWDDSAAYKQGVEVRNISMFMNSVKLADTERTDDEWRTYVVIANSDDFDWEEFDTLKLQISVIDYNTHEDYLHNEKNTAFLTVFVNDTNDCAPEFTEDTTQEVTVTENTASNRIVGNIIATDDDSAPFSTITYLIVPLSPDELVETSDIPRVQINSETGVLRTTDNPIDCDEWQTLQYRYTVTATDGLFYTNMTFTLNIEDINDEIPEVIVPENLLIENNEYEEHQYGRHNIGCIESKDIDYSDDYHTITYYFDQYTDLFEMDGPQCTTLERCCLWAINGSALDREIQETYEIDVYSRDNFEGGNIYGSNIGNTTTFIMTLIDINDNAPVFTNDGASEQYFETKLPDDLKLIDVYVTDEDIGDNGKVYCDEDPEVTSNPDRDSTGMFRVDPVSCNLYATESLRGWWGIYTFLLTAHDKGDPPLSGNGTYTVNITSENLNNPVIIYPQNGEKILLTRDQVIGATGTPLKDVNGNSIPDFEAEDADDPNTGNGQVAFTLTGTDNTFSLYESVVNKRTLQMNGYPPVGEREFPMKLQVVDRGDVPLPGDDVEFTIYVLNLGSDPEFSVSEVNIKFSENSTGMTETVTLPEAINKDYALMDPINRRTIYYYIIADGEDADHFVLDETTGVLRVKKCCLDYRVDTEYTLRVVATHIKDEEIPEDYSGSNVLIVIVEVIDINDLPPEFTQDLFPGTFTSESPIGQKVAELKAVDPDTGDNVTYVIIPGTTTASHSSLEVFVSDDAFIVDPKTGVITLNFSPANRPLAGYMAFEVKAYDSMGDEDGHRDFAAVNVFVVSDAHQVTFHFYNPVSVVEANEQEMADEFSSVLGYTCVVESVKMSDATTDMETSEVLTHFIDEKDKSPVPRGTIENKFVDSTTYPTLYDNFQKHSLSFSGFSPNDTDPNDSSYMTIVLAAVCVVLAVLVVVFSLAFVVRTRTLNQRLDKLTSKKFGSQESGLNRDIMAVPGTNRHALEGSNPVWNHDMEQAFDNMSQSSGDSDLIGIEDSPEFSNNAGGVDNQAFEPQQSASPFAMASAPAYDAGMRRTSINPLAAAAASGGLPASDTDLDILSDPGILSLEDIGLPRRISLNPLTGLDGLLDCELDDELNDELNDTLDGELDAVDVDDVASDAGGATGNSNITFQRPNEPTTEL